MSHDNNPANSVAIVGGGPAGIAMAWFLRELGYRKVSVFEKEHQFGGKCRTVTADNQPYAGQGRAFDMGAVEVTPDYRTVLALIERFRLALTTVPPTVTIDRQTGASFPIPEDPQLGAAFTRYFQILATQYPWLEQISYQQAPPELLVPIDQWLRANRLEILASFFLLPITAFGYGYLNDIPALYVLKFMNRLNLATSLQKAGLRAAIEDAELEAETRAWPKRIEKGFQTLTELMIQDLQSSGVQFHAGVTVTAIQREENGLNFAYTGPGGEVQTSFDRLVIALPPLTNQLGKFLDLRPDEREVFGPLVTNDYATTLSDPRTFEFHLYAEFLNGGQPGIAPPGFPLMFLRVWEDTTDCVFYTLAQAGTPAVTIGENVNTNVTDMQRKPGPATYVYPWTYFPRYLQPQLADDFYGKFYRIQRDNLTCYTGGVANFEIVENAMRYSAFLANDCFRAYPWQGAQVNPLEASTIQGPAVAWYKGLIYIVYVASNGSNDLYCMTYDPASGDWAGDRKIADLPGNATPKSVYSPSLTVAGGLLYLFYKGEQNDAVYLTVFDGDEWNGDDPITMNGAPFQTQYAPAAVTYADRPCVVYTNPDGVLLFTQLRNGQWQPALIVSREGFAIGCKYIPALATYPAAESAGPPIGEAERIRLVYRGDPDSYELYAAALDPDGNGYVSGGLPIAKTANIPARAHDWPALAVAPATNEMYLVFRSDDSHRLRQAIYTESDGWFMDQKIETISSISPTSDDNPGLATYQRNGQDYLFLAYKAAGSNDLYYATMAVQKRANYYGA